MTILQVYVAPHPILKKVADPVIEVNDEIRTLVVEMLETMYENDGIGLAAPQVGISKRVMVIDLDQNFELGEKQARKGNPRAFINPEIIWESEDTRIFNEGCLSVPGQFADIARSDKVKIKYLDQNGEAHEEELDDMLATAVQHELDHLDGILFIDHLSALKRNMLLKKLKKFLRINEEDMEESHVTL